jgi:iron-sulfur cluster assembly protein
MLTITDEAATAIDGILAARDMPNDAGVRVTAEFNPPGWVADPEVQLQLVEEPRPGDQVVDGAPVYLEAVAAALLDARTLDAERSGDSLRFALR